MPGTVVASVKGEFFSFLFFYVCVCVCVLLELHMFKKLNI